MYFIFLRDNKSQQNVLKTKCHTDMYVLVLVPYMCACTCVRECQCSGCEMSGVCCSGRSLPCCLVSRSRCRPAAGTRRGPRWRGRAATAGPAGCPPSPPTTSESHRDLHTPAIRVHTGSQKSWMFVNFMISFEYPWMFLNFYWKLLLNVSY